MILNKNGKLSVIEISKEESKIKVSKIIGKTQIKGQTQLNLIDSRNIIVKKDEYKVDDSVVIENESQKLVSTLKFENKAYVILISGKYGGHHGTIESISEKSIIINLSNGQKIETVKKYAYVVGKEKSQIKLPDSDE